MIRTTSGMSLAISQETRHMASAIIQAGADAWETVIPGVSATIHVHRSPLKVAPEGMIFEVSLDGFETQAPADPKAYNPQLHDLYYFWDYGDVDSQYTATENVMEHQQDANVGYGPVGAHTYAIPNDYTVRVLVVEPFSGKSAVAVLNLSGDDAVRDPNDVFPGPFTFFIDTTGGGTGAPAGAQIRTTFDSAWNSFFYHDQPTRFMFKDGQNFSLTPKRFTSGYPNAYICGQGTGTPPTLRHVGSGALFNMNGFDPDNIKDTVIHSVRFSGDYDPSQANEVANKNVLTHSADQGAHTTVHEVNASGFANFYSTINANNGMGVRIFSNVAVKDYRSYAFFDSSPAPAAYLGVQAINKADALAGGPRNGKHNDGTAWRLQAGGIHVLDGCEGFTRTGWVENIAGYRTQQPVLRWNNEANRGAILNMQRTTLEGGYAVIALVREHEGKAMNVQNAIVERCVVIGSHMTRTHIRNDFGGVTLRNNLMLSVDAPRIHGTFNFRYFMESEAPIDAPLGDIEENKNGLIKIHNNTMISTWSAANGADLAPMVFRNNLTPDKTFNSIIENNNVLHNPNGPTPVTDDGPFNVNALWEPREQGYRSAFERLDFTFENDIQANESVTVPYPAGRSGLDYNQSLLSGEPHLLHIGGSVSAKRALSINFDANAMTVTNTSGQTWEAGDHALVLFCPDSPHNLTQFATPTDAIALYSPSEGSPALGTADEDYCPVADFFGAFRPEYPSRGAFEIET